MWISPVNFCQIYLKITYFAWFLRHTQHSRPIFDYLHLNNKKSPRSKVLQYLWLRNPEFIDFYDDYAWRSSISLKKSITYLRYFVLFWGYFKVHVFHVYFEVVQSIILITSQNFALYQKIGLRFFSQKLVSDAQGPTKPFLNIK